LDQASDRHYLEESPDQEVCYYIQRHHSDVGLHELLVKAKSSVGSNLVADPLERPPEDSRRYQLQHYVRKLRRYTLIGKPLRQRSAIELFVVDSLLELPLVVAEKPRGYDVSNHA
jgi:hypothetical protein